MKTSNSETMLDKITKIEIPNRHRINFEGDGPLGILFKQRDTSAIVSGIVDGTVASEYIELEENMIVTQIGDYDCEFLSYKDVLDLIVLRWKKFSRISIEFKIPENIVEPIKLNKECPIYQLLERLKCDEFYNCFVELGVKTLEDLEFVEYQDLINMKLPTKPRRRIYESVQFNKKINPKNHSHIFSDPGDPFYGLITDDV